MIFVGLWAKFFLITLAIESLVAVPLLGRESPWWRRALAVLLAQILTHPIVWFVLPELRLGRMTYLVLAETWAVALELVFYRLVFTELSWRRALGISAFANGASFSIGLLLQ
jgi:hypothetical protein